MARTFDGTADYLEFAPGAALVSGDLTLAVIAKINDDTERAALMSGRTSGSAMVFSFDRRGGSEGTDPGALMLGNNAAANSRAASVTFLAADGWCLLAVTKVAGVSTPTFHKVPLTVGGTILHVAGNAGLASPNNTLAKVWLGRGGDGDDSQYTAYTVAADAMWNSVLADSQLEALAVSFSEWVYGAPQSGWILDQASVSDLVPDFTGGGATQTAINQTTVSTVSAPIGYGFPAPQVLEAIVAPVTSVPSRSFPRGVAVGVARGVA